MGMTNIRSFTETLFADYTREFGARKSRSLLDSLSESTLLTKTLQQWEQDNHVPNYKELQKVVGAINWFVFSKRETTGLGMILALVRWDEQVNKPKQLASTIDVLSIAFDTLKWLNVYQKHIDTCVYRLIAEE